MSNLSRRATDGRRSRHRAFNGYLQLTAGSLAIAATADQSALTIDIYSKGLGGVRGMGILPKKQDTPTLKPEVKYIKELDPNWHPLWRNDATKKILDSLKRPRPEQRQEIIQAQFGWLCRFVA